VPMCSRSYRFGEHIRLPDVQLALHSRPSPHVSLGVAPAGPHDIVRSPRD
jgi:hypothetical protein